MQGNGCCIGDVEAANGGIDVDAADSVTQVARQPSQAFAFRAQNKRQRAGERLALQQCRAIPAESDPPHAQLTQFVEGSGEMEIDGERTHVMPGDAILIPPGAWHEIRADAGGELRFLCCCAPAYRHEDTFFQ